MSDPRTNSEFQDVLSSIRRLISEDRNAEPRPAGKLVLTAEHRIEAIEVVRPAPGAEAAEEAWQADVHAEVRALSVGARTVDEASATLEDTIAELEAAVAQTGEDFEPDGGEEALSRGRTDPALEGAFDGGFAVDEAAEAEDAADLARLDLPITGDAGYAGPDTTDATSDEAATAAERGDDEAAPAPADAIDDAAEAAPEFEVGSAPDAGEDGSPGAEAWGNDRGVAGAGGQEVAGYAADDSGVSAGAEAQNGPAASPDAETGDSGSGEAGPADAVIDGADGSEFDVADGDAAAEQAEETAAGDANPAVAAAATSRIRRLNLAPAGDDVDDGAAAPEPWARDATQPLLAFAHAAFASAEAETGAEAEDEEPGLFGDGDETVIDMETLRELVADIIRQELQGPLGERITRNVRKLVRREINRALDSRIAEAGDEG